MVYQELNGVVVLRPRGHLYEGEEVDRLESGLGYLLEGGIHQVVVSLIEVGHLSARAVGVMASAHALAERKGGHLVVTGARPEHREVFRITGLAGVIDVRDTSPPAITPFDGFRAAVA